MTAKRSLQILVVTSLVLAGVCGGRALVRVSVQESRERWNVMTPQERERLFDRFAEFKELSIAERRELLRRGERLNEVESEYLYNLSPAERTKLEGLDGVKRRRILRELLVTELLDRGFRVRQELSPDILEFLESVPADDRAFAVRQIERQSFAHRGHILAERLGRSPVEIDELDELELELVEARFLELQREYIRREIKTDNLPPWLTPKEWKKIDSLTDDEFPRAWKRVLRKRSHEYSEASEVDAQGAQPTEQPLRRLRAALSPEPAWYMGLADLPAEERGRRFAQHIRERIVQPLAELGIDPAELDLQSLSHLSGLELNERVRERVRAVLLERERDQKRANKAAGL